MPSASNAKTAAAILPARDSARKLLEALYELAEVWRQSDIGALDFANLEATVPGTLEQNGIADASFITEAAKSCFNCITTGDPLNMDNLRRIAR